jgi:hypothetical protein
MQFGVGAEAERALVRHGAADQLELEEVGVEVVVGAPEMRVGLEAQEERAEQELPRRLIAYLSHQEVQHQLQWLLQEVKLSYHGTHNDISTRYLLRW